MATNLEIAKAKVAEVEEQLRKVKAQAAALAQKIKAKERKTEAKMLNQKKYLLGALMLEKMALDKTMEANVLRELNKFLTRPSDRAKFGLPPLPKPDQAEIKPERKLPNNVIS